MRSELGLLIDDAFSSNADFTRGVVIAKGANYSTQLIMRKRVSSIKPSSVFDLDLVLGVDTQKGFAPLVKFDANGLSKEDSGWLMETFANSMHGVYKRAMSTLEVRDAALWRLGTSAIEKMFIQKGDLTATAQAPMSTDALPNKDVNVSYILFGLPSDSAPISAGAGFDLVRLAGGRGINPPHRAPYFRDTESGAGMTQAGVEKYRRDNPGSNLQTAVTEEVPRTAERAKRRKGFCSRTRNWPNTPRAQAARRRWRCGGV
tara:strand:+ start:7738 stop:8517 length:780 start_codon:yes stop_codon:yes gene_type:complete